MDIEGLQPKPSAVGALLLRSCAALAMLLRAVATAMPTTEILQLLTYTAWALLGTESTFLSCALDSLFAPQEQYSLTVMGSVITLLAGRAYQARRVRVRVGF